MGGGGKGSVDTKDIIRNVKPKLLIDGEWRDAKSGKTFATINPEDETVIMEVAEADAADIDLAVAAARKAFDEGPWPRTSGPERARILNKFADLLEANLDELAALETLDNGKPYAVAKAADLPMSIKHFRYFAGHAATGLTGETIPLDNNMGNMFGYTLIEPIGVVGAVIPWNFPALMLTWKVAPALAAGCTVVVKVAEQTPLTALRYGELFLEAGGPPGVLNILPGYGPTAGARLTSHPDVDKIAFTGSTEVGRIIGGVAGKNLKPVTLELGGKSACIVWKDVDIEKAVEDAHQALFFNMGQCCTAGSRTFVHEDIYEEFVEKAAARAAKRNTGNPWLPDTEAGPQIDKEQFKKILDLIQSGKDQGATLKTGGKRKGDKGFFIEPTVFSDVHDDMEIAKTEIFGPCQSILKYKTIEEVVQRANASNYGLAAGVFAKDVAVVNRLSRALKAGTVWTNCWNQFDAAMPFGGYKDSGVGRDKGHAALHNYTQTKAVYQPLEGDPTWL